MALTQVMYKKCYFKLISTLDTRVPIFYTFNGSLITSKSLKSFKKEGYI